MSEHVVGTFSSSRAACIMCALMIFVSRCFSRRSCLLSFRSSRVRTAPVVMVQLSPFQPGLEPRCPISAAALHLGWSAFRGTNSMPHHFPGDFLRILVSPHSDEARMAKMEVRGPFHKLKLSDEQGFYPVTFLHLRGGKTLPPPAGLGFWKIRKRTNDSLQYDRAA